MVDRLREGGRGQGHVLVLTLSRRCEVERTLSSSRHHRSERVGRGRGGVHACMLGMYDTSVVVSRPMCDSVVVIVEEREARGRKTENKIKLKWRIAQTSSKQWKWAAGAKKIKNQE